MAIEFCLHKDHMDIAGFMTDIRDLFPRKASSIVFYVDKLIEGRVTTKSLLTVHEIQMFDELPQQHNER